MILASQVVPISSYEVSGDTLVQTMFVKSRLVLNDPHLFGLIQIDLK